MKDPRVACKGGSVWRRMDICYYNDDTKMETNEQFEGTSMNALLEKCVCT